MLQFSERPWFIMGFPFTYLICFKCILIIMRRMLDCAGAVNNENNKK